MVCRGITSESVSSAFHSSHRSSISIQCCLMGRTRGGLMRQDGRFGRPLRLSAVCSCVAKSVAVTCLRLGAALACAAWLHGAALLAGLCCLTESRGLWRLLAQILVCSHTSYPSRCISTDGKQATGGHRIALIWCSRPMSCMGRTHLAGTNQTC